MTRSLVLAFGVAVIGLVLATGAATAHTVRFASAVTIDYNLGVFFGDVTSQRAGCVPRRLVTLYQENGGPDTALGTDRTNDAGEWRIEHGISASTPYYAKVARKDIGGAGHDHICRAAESNRLQVDP